MAFKDYSDSGKCDVCGAETDIVVCASTMGPISYAYCQRCFDKKLEPYDGMVAYISCAGRFPDEINPVFQKHVRRILGGLGKSEEIFIHDVNKAIDDMNAYFDKQAKLDKLTDKYLIDEYDKNYIEERDYDEGEV